MSRQSSYVIARNPEGVTKQSVVKVRIRSTSTDCFVGLRPPRNDVMETSSKLYRFIVSPIVATGVLFDAPVVSRGYIGCRSRFAANTASRVLSGHEWNRVLSTRRPFFSRRNP